MTKILIKNQKIFGASAVSDIGIFGSLANQSLYNSLDSDIIQSIPAYDNNSIKNF